MKRWFPILFLGVAMTCRADIVYTNSFTSTADWTLTQPASGFQINFNNGGGGKVRIRSGNGSPGPLASDRFAYFHRTGGLSATGAYDTVLSNSLKPIQWTFSLGDAFGALSGTDYGGTSVSNAQDVGGWIVAGSDSNFYGVGVGYGVSISQGEAAGDSTLTLFKYSGGLSGVITELIDWETADASETGLEDIGNQQTDVRLRYNPATDTWELAGRVEGLGNTFSEPFNDPLAVSYGANDTKTVVEGEFTGQSLGQIGFFLATDHQVPQLYTDNLVIQTIPEPRMIGLVLLGLALLRLGGSCGHASAFSRAP